MSAQSTAALAHANEVRFAGAEIRRQLRAREITLAQALDDPMAGGLWLAGSRGILEAVPRWGERQAGRALTAIGVRGHKRVRELSDRQRDLLGRFATDGSTR